ncbi:MAG TPA: cysteine desulfurase family protein [Acidimicrobiales bacterium]|nr:cysteine desulfurase family protein [Acidimicrobiales bacterium]
MTLATKARPPGAYLDHAATTPMRREAVAAMLPHLEERFANPSGLHAASRAARRALDEARDGLSASLGCEPGEVVLTSGGTESDNLAVLGVAGRRGGTVVVSAVEHRAVLRPAASVGARVVPVGADGRIDVAALAALLDPGVSLVSVMLVNSEVGVVQPVGDVVAAVRRLAPGALVHCDAVQGVLWCDVAALTAGCDLVSVSAHKFGGPKGVGALVVRDRAAGALTPLLTGGGQERELRAGTENVAGAVAMAAAARLTVAERRTTVARVGALRDQFVDGVLAGAPGAAEPAPRALRVAGSAHLRFPGVDAEELLFLLDAEGVAASTGSACASGARDPSHVLLAMGWAPAEARQAVRFTLGPTTTLEEVEYATRAVLGALGRLGARNQLGD